MVYLSSDGEEGYPGNLVATVNYKLTNDNELKIEMSATTDRPTPINLAHHSYWNLANHAAGDVLEHELKLNADCYTPTDDQLIPTGKIEPIKGTPYDFTQFTRIRDRLSQLKDDSLRNDPSYYDLNYVLNGEIEKMKLAAMVHEPKSGRVMEIHTTEPGVQFYLGYLHNFNTKGKCGVSYKGYQGLCLETQHFPDSVNKPNFPSVILYPTQTYQHTMVHKFYTLN